MPKLEVGEKYLTIWLFGGQVKLTAFPNKNKKDPKEPDFKGYDGVAVWVSEKKAESKGTVSTSKFFG
jgi:hypothetical protein